MLEEDKIKDEQRKLWREIDKLHEKMDIYNDSIGEIKYILKSMSIYISGNIDTDPGDKGLIGRISRIETAVSEMRSEYSSRFTKIDKYTNKGIGLIFGLSVGTGYAVADLLSKVFLKS